jgi:tetratricopeptide (TPR) repeat protein
MDDRAIAKRLAEAIPAGSAISPYQPTMWGAPRRREVSSTRRSNPKSRDVKSCSASSQRIPSNTGWQRDVSVSDIEIGNVALAQGDAAKALASYRHSLAIRDKLAKSDPNNAGWQRDLAIAHGRVGLALAQQGKMGEAFAELGEGRELVSSLKQKFSASAALAQDLAWFDKRHRRYSSGRAVARPEP